MRRIFSPKQVLRVVLFFCCSCSVFANAALVIGIAGGTGSGKTTIAEKLMGTFLDQAVLVRQDDYYRDLSHLLEEERKEVNFDHPSSIDFELFREHILQLKQNRSIEKPSYNFCTHTREPYTAKLDPANIIIIEGILIFAVPEIRDLCDLKIFAEADDDIRLVRRIARDVEERGRDFQSISHQYLTTVKPMHDAFVEPSKRYADVIIPTLQRSDIGLNLLISSLKNDISLVEENRRIEKSLSKNCLD